MTHERSLDTVLASRTQYAILRVLADADTELHPPEICRLGGQPLKKTTIYVVLGRMQKKGLVESRLEEKQPSRSGPARRLFALTQKGRQVLAATDAAQEALQRFRLQSSTRSAPLLAGD